MLIGCYILIAWVTMLLVGLVGFVIFITLKNYGLIDRPSREMNIMLIECYTLLAWLILLAVAVVAFGIDAVIHGY